MSGNRVVFSVFTKPWKMPLPELGEHVRNFGFEAIELPVRPGYQVPPEQVKELPRAAKVLEEQGVRIASVAGPADEPTIAACAEAGIPVLRVMAPIQEDEGYLEGIARLHREYDQLLPLLERYHVTLGVQNHMGRYVANSMGLLHLLERYDSRYVGAVWDAGHNALAGEEPELGLDIVWSHLCMVNLKNAFWRRVTGPEAEQVAWRPYWTSGRQGLAPWPRIAAELKRRNYQGVVCLTAEYSDESAVNRLILGDIIFAKSLF